MLIGALIALYGTAFAQFNETYSPVDMMVTPIGLGTQAILGADGDYYYLRNSVSSSSTTENEIKFSARFLECGGSQARLRDLVALPDGRFYAGGTAFTPDSASCGAVLQQGGGSYDAIIGYFSASGRMIWGHTFSEVRVQDSWQNLIAQPDGSVYALGNQFQQLRITQFDSSRNVRFDSVFSDFVEGFFSTQTTDGMLHVVNTRYDYLTFDPATAAITNVEIQPGAGVDLDKIYTSGDMVELPDGNLAFAITYETDSPFLRSLRVLKINRAGQVIDVFPAIGQQPIINHFARDIKMIDGELFVLGGVGDGVTGIFQGMTLSALDPVTFEARFTDLFTGQQLQAFNLESYKTGSDTLLIHGTAGNFSGTFNTFPVRTGSIGPMRIARCSVNAGFGYSAAGRTSAFTNFSSADAIDFEWDFGDGNSSFLDDPTHTYSSDGNYTVCLRSRSRNYCEAEFCTTVQIPNGVSSSEGVLAKAPKLEVSQTGNQLALKLTSGRFNQIELFDITGRKVAEQRPTNLQSTGVSTAVLPKGVYTILAVLRDGSTLSHRVFIH